MSHKKEITYATYIEMKDYLQRQMIEQGQEESIVNLYKNLTGDTYLRDFHMLLVEKEIATFLESVRTDLPGTFTLDDYGYDDDHYYLRFWVTDFDLLKVVYPDIMEFLSSVAQRTGVEIRPEFNLWRNIIPSEQVEKVEILPPKFKNLIDIELN